MNTDKIYAESIAKEYAPKICWKTHKEKPLRSIFSGEFLFCISVRKACGPGRRF